MCGHMGLSSCLWLLEFAVTDIAMEMADKECVLPSMPNKLTWCTCDNNGLDDLLLPKLL